MITVMHDGPHKSTGLVDITYYECRYLQDNTASEHSMKIRGWLVLLLLLLAAILCALLYASQRFFAP